MTQSTPSLEVPMFTLKTKDNEETITDKFSAEDINLASFPHTDVMVITIHIDRWEVSGSCTQVPWAASYGPTHLDMTLFPLVENNG
jgi:hypothetical protein